MINNASIGIIGNMNNAGFAIMRHLRTLGADAHLLPFADDGGGSHTHFAPEADTFQIERWTPYISPLRWENRAVALLGKPLVKRAPPSEDLVEALRPYRYLIGSGVAPILAYRAQRRLDIFWNYGSGIEFFGDHLFRAQMRDHLVRRIWYGQIRRLQARGILEARWCLNADLSASADSYSEIGRSFVPVGFPALYPADTGTVADLKDVKLVETAQRMKDSDLSVFCCSSQVWVPKPHLSPTRWQKLNRNSDWLYRGFADFVHSGRAKSPLLVAAAYGPDVGATKALIEELGISDYVIMLPRLWRRDIMVLLGLSNVGVGEFIIDDGLVWGSTGWEVLASGRPLLQSFNFTASDYEAQFGHQPPPILDVRSAEEITQHLDVLYRSPTKGRALGDEARRWFDCHGGIGLARRWLSFLSSNRDQVR